MHNNPNPYEDPEVRRALGTTFRPGGLKLTEQALAHCRLVPGAAILDIGCGAGATLALLSSRGMHPLGLDLSDLLLAEASRCAPVIKADACRLPIRGNRMDAVFLECVLCLLNNQGVALAESYRSLKPGGFLILSTAWIRPHGLATLEKQVRETGFSIEHKEDHSRELVEMGIRLVWALGSGECMHRLLTPPGCTADMEGAGHNKYGYVLLIARKPSP